MITKFHLGLYSDVISSCIEMPRSYIQMSHSSNGVSHSYIRQWKCSSAVNMRTCQGRYECILVSTLDLKEYINCFVK